MASGAKAVAANGAFDIPYQLIRWAKDRPYQEVVAAGNDPVGLRLSDTIAQTLGFDNVNSEKTISGDMDTRISSLAIAG